MNEPINATYVGPAIDAELQHLQFGLTGVSQPWSKYFRVFIPDGSEIELIIPRRQLYIPQLDKTRYCPCP